MKKVLFIFLMALVGVLIPNSAGALESPAGIDFSIRFFDRRIYYVETAPIYVQVTVTNNSPSTYRFKLADERAFSIDFDARTISNRPLDQADLLIRKRTQSQQVFFREIAVETGESFSFVEDLRDYVSIKEPGSMVIRARMYPELYRPNVVVAAAVSGTPLSITPVEILESQRINLNVRPAIITDPEGIPLEMDVATGATLVRERLAPDQVVEYMLSARQKSQWERFFLYLDLETMLSRDSLRRRRWIAESEEGRRRMVKLFREELQAEAIDGSISLIPSSFTIQRTEYSNTEGTVVVLQKFSNHRVTEVKQYTYFLRMSDNIWTIIDYRVDNMGTE